MRLILWGGLILGCKAGKKEDKLVDVWHFTDKDSYNAITSSGKDIIIKANKPRGGNPTGTYFSKLSPEILVSQSKKIAVTLQISKAKTEYVIKTQLPESILKEKGGRHRAIVYTKDDVKISNGNWTGGKAEECP